MEIQASTTPNCTKDWVNIYDGETNQTRLLKSLCDNNYIPSMMTSTSNRLLITFHSDFYDQSRGFNISYTTTGRLNVFQTS